MGVNRYLLLIGFILFSSANAVTNAFAQKPGYRGVFRIGPHEIDSSCSAVLVAKDVEYFYLLTAAHCVLNSTDGGVALFDPFNGEATSYKSLKVYFPDYYTSDPRYLTALDKDYKIETGTHEISKKEKEKKVIEMSIKLFAQTVESKVHLSAEQGFYQYLNSRLTVLNEELDEADSKLREKVLGQPPDEEKDKENFASLSTEYYDFENEQNNDFSYAMIYEAPDVALLQFSYFDFLQTPSSEFTRLIKETKAAELASVPDNETPVSYIGYEDKLVPSEGTNEISASESGKKIDYFDPVYEFISYYGVSHYHYREGDDPVDYEDPEKFFPPGTHSAIQGGDSGGAAFQGAKLRGIICQKSYTYLKKNKLGVTSWPALSYDENPDYEVHHSISADLTSAPLQLFLRKLESMGVPLNL